MTADRFSISRQAVHRHLRKLLENGELIAKGTTRNRTYELGFRVLTEFSVPISPDYPEDLVWRDAMARHFDDLPENVRSLWQYGFTEMFNNAIDHSAGTGIFVGLGQEGLRKSLVIRDDGEGIFRKIKRALALPDEHTAIVELAKGKLTTDPRRHSGEGIFFSSRAFDAFSISSGGLHFSHQETRARDVLIDLSEREAGTTVWIDQADESERALRDVFDRFSSEKNDYQFSKTMLALDLARHEGEKLVSRSQARRLVNRFESFREVVLDFAGIKDVGQAFADEVFRVFAIEHPKTALMPINMNEDVTKMVSRAQVAALMARIGPEDPDQGKNDSAA